MGLSRLGNADGLIGWVTEFEVTEIINLGAVRQTARSRW